MFFFWILVGFLDGGVLFFLFKMITGSFWQSGSYKIGISNGIFTGSLGPRTTAGEPIVPQIIDNSIYKTLNEFGFEETGDSKITFGCCFLPDPPKIQELPIDKRVFLCSG